MKKQIRRRKRSCCRITVRQSRTTDEIDDDDIQWKFKDLLLTLKYFNSITQSILVVEAAMSIRYMNQLLCEKCDFDRVKPVIRISVDNAEIRFEVSHGQQSNRCRK
jgi:hypothetical protein